jgi:competence protein ComFC
MQAALARVWKTLFPERCLGCGARDVIVCSECREGIRPLPRTLCPRCARPERLGNVCRRCAAEPNLDALVAATVYQGVVRRAIHELKFRQGRYLAPFLADLLMGALVTRPIQADFLVPVPLSARRLRERGFNQAAILADEIHARGALGAAILAPEVLHRPRDTRPQFTLSARERRTNLRDAFTCGSPAAIRGRRVALIDDVCTTGATLRACASVLRAAGAERVTALVVARDL